VTIPPRRRLRADPALGARIVRAVPLRYAAGADPALDRPAHVRAASGITRVDGRLVVVQDDANFVALVDPETGLAEPVTLPAGEGGLRQFDDLRGNKRFKLDLEGCAVAREGEEEVLLALGSGSLPPRERIVLLRGIGRARPEARVADASALYARLRACTGFAGSELNVEGAAVVGGRLRLFNRGNGAAQDGLLPVNAACDLDLAHLLAYVDDPSSVPPPEPEDVVQYEIGEIDGLPLTFTDAAVHAGRVWFTAAAEASPDAVRDGPVAGCAIGVLEGDGGRWTELRDADGRRFAGKVEGLLPRDASSGWVIVDHDDPTRASELCEVELAGFAGALTRRP
jgi:uncharacterized protein DUF6929